MSLNEHGSQQRFYVHVMAQNSKTRLNSIPETQLAEKRHATCKKHNHPSSQRP